MPERAEGRLPKSTVTLTLTHAGAGRDLSIVGDGPAFARIERSLQLRDFLAGRGEGAASRRPLGGDASARGYNYVDLSTGDTRILMDSPRAKPGPILRDGKYYQQLAHIAEDVVPFVAIAGYLRRQGFRAPAVLEADLDRGILLLEDLGTGSILDEVGAPLEDRYGMSRGFWPRCTPRRSTPLSRLPMARCTTFPLSTAPRCRSRSVF